MLRSIGSIASTLVLTVAFTLSTTTAEATECRVREGACLAIVNVVVDTTPPFVICYQGVANLTVSIQINCIQGSGGGPSGGSKTQNVCADSATPIEIADGDFTHVIAPASGTWDDVLDGHCTALEYTIN
jgi:hypothetical protein